MTLKTVEETRRRSLIRQAFRQSLVFTEKTSILSSSPAVNHQTLSKQGCQIAWICLFGYKPSKLEMKSLLKNNHVSMDEFEEIVWNKKMKYIDETDQIRSIFHALDSHGQNSITYQGLNHIHETSMSYPKDYLLFSLQSLINQQNQINSQSRINPIRYKRDQIVNSSMTLGFQQFKQIFQKAARIEE